ncbi:MAG: GNAT family N-acetyltransferase [Crocinitomicaceae bacterium]
MKLKTERTEIIPFVKDHIPLIIQMFHEPDSNRFIRPLHGKTDEEFREILENKVDKNQKLLQWWTVFHRDTSDFIGTLNINEFNETGYIQLGVHLSVKYWKQGYAFELCQTMLAYAFEVRNLQVLYWVFEKGHTTSKKLAEKLGFKPFKEMEDRGCPLWVYKMTSTT